MSSEFNENNYSSISNQNNNFGVGNNDNNNIKSINGTNMSKDDFTHNNMVPFFGARIRGALIHMLMGLLTVKKPIADIEHLKVQKEKTIQS